MAIDAKVVFDELRLPLDDEALSLWFEEPLVTRGDMIAKYCVDVEQYTGRFPRCTLR